MGILREYCPKGQMPEAYLLEESCPSIIDHIYHQSHHFETPNITYASLPELVNSKFNRQ